MWMTLAVAATAEPEAIAARLREVAPLMSLREATARPSVPSSAWSRVAAGEIVTGVQEVEGHAARMGWGVGLLDVAIGRFWSGLNDELYHKELLGLGHVEVVKGRLCAEGRQVMMLLPLPLVSDRWWVVENNYALPLQEKSGGTVRELSWNAVDPATVTLSDTARELVADAVPVTFNTGAWLLVALGEDQTLVEYHSWSDPGGEVPAGPATSFASATIEDTIRAMERYARDNEPRCRL